ncbi:MAG: hypothetical protein ACOYWZ_15695 [Bacillota bacterium]
MVGTHRPTESLDAKKHGYFGGTNFFYINYTITANYVKVPFTWLNPHTESSASLSATRSKRIMLVPPITNTGTVSFSFDCVDVPDAPLCEDAGIAGNLNGIYKYKITFVTAEGESLPSSASAAVTVINKKVNVTIPLNTDPTRAVTSRKLYRTVAGGSDYFLVSTIANNLDTTYLDNVADGSLGGAAPTINTTGQLAGELTPGEGPTLDGVSFTAIYIKGTAGDKIKIWAWG